MTSLISFSQHTAQDTVVRLPYFKSLMMSCAVQMVVTWYFSFSWTSVLHLTPLTMKFSWCDCLMRWAFPVLLISGFVHTWLTEDTSQWGSLCQDPAGNWTTRRPPDDHKGMHTAVVWSCLLFIRSGQNHLARHSERGKKTRQTEEDVGRQHQRMERPGVRQVPKGGGDQGKMEKTGYKIMWCPNDPHG